MNHTFAICAYRESPYLEACIQSVLAQQGDSQVIVCTSTPNASIQALCDKYQLPLKVNRAASAIHSDWNFALSQAKTTYVTLCHQDDVYEPGYRAAVEKAAEKGFTLFMTDYAELRGTEKRTGGKLLTIKKVLLFPLRLSWLQGRKWAKRGALRFGNGICCPSVTYYMPHMPQPLFEGGLKSNLDWQTWERLSRLPGRFCYVPQPLMCHRIHAESETSRIISENQRGQEDYQMFLRFWPAPVAKCLTRLYAASEDSNAI